MRRLVGCVVLLLLAGCDSGSSPTSPASPAPIIVEGRWNGVRTPVEVTEGAGTCLGDLISSRPPTPVEVLLPPISETYVSVGSVQSRTPYFDGCTTSVHLNGNQLSWSIDKCSAPCWLEQFKCGGSRVWTYCRSWHSFDGTVSGDRLTGSQLESFQAISGDKRYRVEVRYEYDLQRN